jgi:hypothetical protein
MIRSRPDYGTAGPAPRILVLVLVLVFLISGCGRGQPDAAAAQPPVVPGETTQGPDLSGVQVPNFVMPLIHGSVSVPNPKLTPGAVTTTDANAICTTAPHSAGPQVATAMQAIVYHEYGYTSAPAQHKHVMDLLVPHDLGGALVLANVWPIAVAGTGFYEKDQTNAILRQMVCRRELTLAQAQRALETNWYAAWLRYVVATGHI